MANTPEPREDEILDENAGQVGNPSSHKIVNLPKAESLLVKEYVEMLDSDEIGPIWWTSVDKLLPIPDRDMFDLEMLARSNPQWNATSKLQTRIYDVFDKSPKWVWNLHDLKGRFPMKPSDFPKDGEKPTILELWKRKNNRTQRLLAGGEENSATESA